MTAKNKIAVALSACVFLFLALFTWRFVAQEKFIYFYDYAGYHTMFRKMGETVEQNLFLAVAKLGNSIRNYDYNYLPTVFLLPFYHVFGASRLAYIGAVVAAFVFPAALLFAVTTAFFAERTTKNFDLARNLLLPMLLFGLLPQIWIPVYLGYLDVAGVSVIFAVWILFFHQKFSEQRVRQIVFLGLLLSFLVMLRRWYAYWAVGFIVAAALASLLDAARNKFDFAELRRALKNLLIVGAVAGASSFIVATPIAIKMIVTDFRDAFSAFKHNQTLVANLSQTIAHYGWLIIALVAFGFAVAIWNKDLRRVALVLSANFAATFVLFTRVQDVDLHHYYWITPIFLVFAFVGAREIYERLNRTFLQAIFLFALAALFAGHFLIAFQPGADDRLNSLAFLYTNKRIYPKERRDLPQMLELMLYLQRLTDGTNDKIYLLSSSISLNGGVLKNACHSFEPRSLRDLDARILYTNDVDKRDGFPFQFLTAKYAIVADPIGYHLSPADQRVVGVLAEQLLEGNGLGASFERLDFEITLEDNRKVRVYRKIKDLDQTELDKVLNQFIELYPHLADKFTLTPEVLQKASQP